MWGPAVAESGSTGAHDWTGITVPRDVEAELVAALERFGIKAGTQVPAARSAGMIRVSRTGGDLTDDGYRDRAEVLVECWGTDSVEAFDNARRVWAAFAVFKFRQWLRPGVAAHDVEISPPRSLDDEYAPELYRQQFTADLMVSLEETALTERQDDAR